MAKDAYKRLAGLEARLDAMTETALSSWLDVLSDDDLRTLTAYQDACAEAGARLPLSAEMQAIERRMMTDPDLAEVRNRATWYHAGRTMGQVWRELV